MNIRSATQPLRELLESHGVTCHEEGSWLRLGDAGLRAQAQYVNAPGFDSERTVQLDVLLELWAGRLLTESFGGVGNTPAEAARSAFENFAWGSLHVLLAAFVRTTATHVTVKEWNVGGIPRRVLSGSVMVRGKQRAGAAPLSWVESLEGALRSLPLAPGTHWLRIYFAQMQERPMSFEVLLDNEDWPELRSVLENAPWPRSPDFVSHRLFLVLQGGVDVSRAVAAFVEPPGREADSLRDEIRAHGSTVLESEKLVAFIPEAFGAVMAREMGAKPPETSIFSEQDGPGQDEVLLAQDPLWQEAVRNAELAFAGQTLSSAQLEAVLDRSALLAALNQLLRAGSKLEDLVFTPLHIVLSSEGMAELRSQDAKVRAALAMQSLVSVAPSEPSAEAQLRDAPKSLRRPWWKFW